MLCTLVVFAQNILLSFVNSQTEQTPENASAIVLLPAAPLSIVGPLFAHFAFSISISTGFVNRLVLH